MAGTPKQTARIPEFRSVQEAAEFWDTHDSTAFEDEWEPVDFEIDPRSSSFRLMSLKLEYSLYKQLRTHAEEQGMTATELAERWLEAALARLSDASTNGSQVNVPSLTDVRSMMAPHWPQWSEARGDASVFRTRRHEYEYGIVQYWLPDGRCEVKIMSRHGQGAWREGARQTLDCAEAARRVQSMRDDPETAFVESVL